MTCNFLNAYQRSKEDNDDDLIFYSQPRFVHHLDDAFAHAKNGWVYVTTSGEEVASDLIETIHKRINQDMRRMAAVMPYEGINGLIFQSSLYKYLDGFRQVIDEETGEEVPFHFIDRVKALESDDSDSLSSWEDFINDTP